MDHVLTTKPREDRAVEVQNRRPFAPARIEPPVGLCDRTELSGEI